MLEAAMLSGVSRGRSTWRCAWRPLLWALLLPGLPAWADPAGLEASVTQESVQEQIDVLDRLIESRPDALHYVKRGEAHYQAHNFDKAIADFSKAIQLNDRLDDAYYGRGMALARHGEVERGIADLGVYIRRHPDSSLAHTKRGVRYLWNGDEANAEQDFLKAIALDPRNAEAHDDLGVIRARRAEYDRAMEHFNIAIRVDPSYHKAYHNLALVYYLVDRESQALKAVDAALKLAPEDRNTLLLKSKILSALGRHDEAKRVKEDADFLPAGNWSERMPVN